ncbi:MAG: DNA-directed RNA polymerase subunit omega [Phycisphaerales bacterium]|nr:MAG: DNA-directed RNA polymerase subunit omega [Phycisphaerales bacterium]
MIEVFKNDVLSAKCGGNFKLAALIQKRWLQLMQGARPMVESRGLTELEVIVQEILEGKIEMHFPEEEPEEEDEG